MVIGSPNRSQSIRTTEIIDQAIDDTGQGRFARTVGADNGSDLCSVKIEAYSIEDAVIPPRMADILSSK